MYATEADVASWLSSIPNLKNNPLPIPSDVDRDDEHQGRQRKRRKLTSHRHKLPSPPASEPTRLAAAMPSSSSLKRSRDTDDVESPSQPEEAGNEITPRPGRFQQTEIPQWIPFTGGSSHGTPSLTSSASNQSASNQSASMSSNTSPTRQIRNAETNETGFRIGSFYQDTFPASLGVLRRDLRLIQEGWGILPASLENSLRGIDTELPRFAFDRDEATRARTEEVTSDLPSYDWVRSLLKRADACEVNQECEASWNGDIHAPILQNVFRSDQFTGNGPIDYRWSQPAQIISTFRPQGAPSKMVDFCVFYRPERGSVEDQALVDVCQRRPCKSINHTDLGDLCKWPIVLSIETKRPGIELDKAKLQIGTWHSGQWRSLRWKQTRPSRSIEFLPGIIVQGHDWQFVASILDSNNQSVLLKGVRIGGTDSELGIYSLLLGLRRLRRWVVDDYWPRFAKDILNISVPAEEVVS